MTKTFAALLGILLAASATSLAWFSCSVEQPSVGKDDEDTKFQHAEFTEDHVCTECHEEDRPTPEHGKDIECGTCHEPKDVRGELFTPKPGITSSGENKTNTASNTDTTSSTGSGTGTGSGECDPAKAHEHPPGLTSCSGCHEKDRPDPPHVASGDCAACHESNNTGCPWTPK